MAQRHPKRRASRQGHLNCWPSRAVQHDPLRRSESGNSHSGVASQFSNARVSASKVVMLHCARRPAVQMALPNGAPLGVSLSHLLAFLVSGVDESAVRFRTLLYIAVQTHSGGRHDCSQNQHADFSYRSLAEGSAAPGSGAAAPLHRQHGGSDDSGLLRPDGRTDPIDAHKTSEVCAPNSARQAPVACAAPISQLPLAPDVANL